MTVMGVVGCSVLANELAYLIRRDPEAKSVVMIDTPEGRVMAEKLERTMACENIELVDWEHMRLRTDLEDQMVVWMNPANLHDSKEKMRNALTSEVVMLSGVVDGIMMLYGQCRCQTLDVRALQSEAGVPIIFLTDRSNCVVDDCFAATLGGCKSYQKMMLSHKGTLFVTPGYIEEQARRIQSSGLLNIIGEVENMQMLFDYMDYKKIMKLDNQLDMSEDYDDLVNLFSRTFDLEVDMLLCNLAVFEDTYDWAKSAMKAHAGDRQMQESYVVVWG